MSARTARRVAHGLWAGTGALWLLALVLVLTASPQVGTDLFITVVVGIPMATYASVGALVARSSPGNPIGWLLASVGLAAAVWMAGLAYAQVGLEPGGDFGTLPGAAATAWLALLSVYGVLPGTLPMFLLIFPDGRLRSRRWRPVLGATVLGMSLMVVGAIGISWDLDPVRLRPLVEGIRTFELLAFAGLLTVVGAAFAGLLALVLRFREADPEQRQPLRLLVGVLAAMGTATALALVINLAAAGAEWTWFLWLLAIIVDGLGVLVGIPLAAAAAVLTFGLYDVGVVVKKTVVYVVLVALFLVLLALFALALNPLALFGRGVSTDTRDTVASIATAGAVIAVVLVLGFRPIKRLARRLVYGRRSTPYEAISEFSERVGDAYSTQDVLPRMAAILRDSTGASVTRVWLSVGRELRPVAAAPAGSPDVPAIEVAGDEAPALEGARVFPVRDRGELLGALTVAMPPAEPLSKTGEQLVVDLAGQAGLVLRNVRLVEELQESRRRIVAAQDERARKLERNLHDGAQQQLVAISVKLGLAEKLLPRDPERGLPLVGQAKAETLEALDTLRDLARGIYPPLLADKGLRAALEERARKSPVEVRVDGDGDERFGADVEAAVYFCCLEAMQNVAKYANATCATIRLARSDGELTFEVSDDGAGFDPAQARGSGLTNMRDRLEALGGALQVASAPAQGTTVRGRVPVGAPT